MTTKLCGERNPANQGMSCSLPPDHASPHAMGEDGGTWPTVDPPSTENDYTPRLATPIRPYPPDAPLVAVHEAAWEDAQEAESRVPELEDALANADAYATRMPDKIAEYLLTHVGGDESQPWQAGHNYAMREAARLVRERYFALDEGDPTPEDGLTTPPGTGR